jgi:hypothetical protein
VSELRQKIEFLEAQIAADKVALGLQVSSLKKQITTPQFIIPALIGCVCLGYFMPHRKHIAGTIPTTLIKNLRTILPLIIA